MTKIGEIVYEEINSFKSCLDYYCAKYDGNNFFVRKGENGPEHITYNEFREDCCRVAAGLLDRGITEKHIAIISENNYEYLVMYLATVMAGNVFVPINQSLEEDKRNGLMNFADVNMVILSKEHAEYKEGIMRDCKAVTSFIYLDYEDADGMTYEEIKNTVSAEKATSMEFKDSVYNDNLSLLSFTSGTTGGIPKAVMLSVKNVLACIRYGTHDAYGEWYPLRLLPLPLYHLAALNFIFYTFIPQGTEMALCKEVKDIFGDLYYYKPQYVIVVPALSEAILKILEGELEKSGKREEFEKYNIEADQKGLSYFDRKEYGAQFKTPIGGELVSMTFAGAKSSEQIKRSLGKFGMYVRDGYGMTECAPMVTVEYDECRMGSVGQICPFNSIDIIDGVAYIKGDNVTKGYYKNPEGTKQALTDDGWFCTGDLAKIDEDNFLYILGRAKNVIVLGDGENIDPEEIEAVINKSQFVAESLVVPDEQSNNTRIGVLIYPNMDNIIKDGRDVQTVIAEVMAQINKTLPIAKRMHRFKIMDKPFERNSMMKLLRRNYPDMNV